MAIIEIIIINMDTDWMMMPLGLYLIIYNEVKTIG